MAKNSVLEEPTIAVRYFDPRRGKLLNVEARGERWWRDVRMRGLWKATVAKLRGETRWNVSG